MLAAVTVLALLARTAFAGPARLTRRDTPLSVSLEAPSSIDDIDDLKVSAKITNNGESTLTLVHTPHSLLSTWKTNTFNIAADGTSADFTGVMVKADPLRVARTVLAPGESTTVEHELAGAYSFESAGAGKYQLDPLSTVFTAIDSDNLSSIEADVSSAAVELTGVGKLVSNEAMSIVKTGENVIKSALGSLKRATFDGCSDSQKTDINSATDAAQSYASESYSFLQANDKSATRYTTWFGTGDYQTVTTHFSNLNSGDYSSFEYNCNCDESGTYAYTYPAQYGKVWLCDAFWDAPVTGTDSKGGTLIHESTHFNKNAGTQDYVYGQSDAKSLAKSNPAHAIMNADNHEYFAEAGGSS